MAIEIAAVAVVDSYPINKYMANFKCQGLIKAATDIGDGLPISSNCQHYSAELYG